jgi:hypothetical protein
MQFVWSLHFQDLKTEWAFKDNYGSSHTVPQYSNMLVCCKNLASAHRLAFVRFVRSRKRKLSAQRLSLEKFRSWLLDVSHIRLKTKLEYRKPKECNAMNFVETMACTGRSSAVVVCFGFGIKIFIFSLLTPYTSHLIFLDCKFLCMPFVGFV